MRVLPDWRSKERIRIFGIDKIAHNVTIRYFSPVREERNQSTLPIIVALKLLFVAGEAVPHGKLWYQISTEIVQLTCILPLRLDIC